MIENFSKFIIHIYMDHMKYNNLIICDNSSSDNLIRISIRVYRTSNYLSIYFSREVIGKNSKISNKIFGKGYCLLSIYFSRELIAKNSKFSNKILGTGY